MVIVGAFCWILHAYDRAPVEASGSEEREGVIRCYENYEKSFTIGLSRHLFHSISYKG